ncbi:MAG: V/A-type H+-transporting ATPase subunit D, partial [Verrucomicrobiales bacterium]
MARIRLTKNELKAQRDALKRYQRYLPTLQLKKQQLQAELWSLESELHEKEAYLHELRTRLNAWIELFSEPFDFEGHLSIVQIDDQPDRIAGVEVVLLKEITFT